MKKKILLFDAFSLAFRAFYSYPMSLSLPTGEPINAVFGMMSMIFQAIDQIKPEFVCVCFDRKEPTFRKELYSHYKAHRTDPPPEFKSQIPYLSTILDDCGMYRLDCAGYEADDILGTIATDAESDQFEVLIMTGDQDAFQLVDDSVNVLINKKGVSEIIRYDAQKVFEKMGITPAQIVDYKALRGDSSDNIPGVKGVGDKTAIKLLTEYHTLDGIYENLAHISSKSLWEKLNTDKELAYMSQKLATIYTKVPINIDYEKMAFNPNWDAILNTFETYQFRALINRYKDKQQGSTSSFSLNPPDTHVQIIQSERLLQTAMTQLKQGFAIDLETTSSNPLDAQIVGISLSRKFKTAYYIPIDLPSDPIYSNTQLGLFLDPKETTAVADSNSKDTLDLPALLAVLKPFLEDESIPKYAHNAKYEIQILNRYGISLKGLCFDTMLAAHLLFPTDRVGLKDAVARHLNIHMNTFEEVLGDKQRFDQVDKELAAEYAGADADCTLRLKQYFDEKFSDSLRKLFDEIEMPLISVLAKMELNGVMINNSFLSNLAQDFNQKMKAVSQEIFKEMGGEINLNSPKQLAEVLFEKMGLPVLKRSKSGPSTDSSVLEELAQDHLIAEKLLRYRSYSKLLSTYVEALPKMTHHRTGLVHSSFQQTIVATGRLSSTHPNLQNIPIRSKDGAQIREAFVSRFESGVILSADYSQIELRVLAYLSQDPEMIQAFQSGYDIHRATAALIFNVAYDEVTKQQRDQAKTVNFGITYGQSAFALGKQLHISRKEAQDIIDAYFQRFSHIQAFFDETLAFAREYRGIQTMFGRWRPLPDIISAKRNEQAFAQRVAINSRVQGTAAELMKLAMIAVDKELQKLSTQTVMIIQVHDELVFDVPNSELDQISQIIKYTMESVLDLTIPLVVDIQYAKSWKAKL